MQHRPRKRKQIHALDKYVIFSIGILIIYTAIALWASFQGVTNDTLTTCVYGFFGGEIVTCALIKIFKLREENKSNEELEEVNLQ